MNIDVLKPYLSGMTAHGELRAHTNYTNTIMFTNGNLTMNQRSDISGVFARIYKDGVFGAASYPGINEDSVKRALEGAKLNADVLALSSRHRGHILGEVKNGEAKAHIAFVKHPQSYLLDFVTQLDAHIAARYKGLSGRSVRLLEECTSVSLAVTDGFDVERVLPRCHIVVRFTVKDSGGAPVDLSVTLGGGGLFDMYFKSPTDFDGQLDLLYSRLMDKRDGVYAEAGEHDLILDSEMAGILAHEAIGHTVESDLVRGGSIAKNFRNMAVGSEKVSLVDFAHTALGEQAPLPIFVDDEGTKAEDVVIIKDGVLLDYMCNRFDAPIVGTTPKGNGRAFSYKDEPIVRMRNTCILPGKDKLEDMIASVEKGYYLITPSNGQADGTSEFMFGVTMGYEIKDGKLGRAIKDTTLCGVAFDMLKTVSMVGDSVKWKASGRCGKKQPMGNAMGGPALKCRAVLGGR